MVRMAYALALGAAATLLVAAGGGGASGNNDPHGHHCRKGEFSRRVQRNGHWHVICVPALKPRASAPLKRNGDPHQVVHPVKTVVHATHR